MKSKYLPGGLTEEINKQTDFKHLNTPFGKNVQMEIENADEYRDREAGPATNAE